jgi:glycosyltransferase involved in cell wall biosynthesis
VALELCKDFDAVIAAPFFGKYHKTVQIRPRLTVNDLYFPSSSEYPPKSQFTKLMQVFSLAFYSTEVVFKTIELKRKGLRILLVSDFVSGFVPAIVAKILNLRVVCYEGNITPWAEPSFTPKVNSFVQTLLSAFISTSAKITGRLSDAVVVNDGLIKNGMVNSGIKEGKIFVIRGMVDIEVFKPLEGELSKKDEFVVGFNGRLNKEKGADLLLDLCKTALDKLPQVHFIILGDGQFKDRLKVLPNVKHVGQVAHNELCSSLSPVKIVVTFQKTFGMGEVEALSCGKPLIASKVGEMPALIENEGIGLICEPNVSSYIEAIELLYKNELLIKKLSEGSRMYAIKRHDSSVICGQWKSMVNRILQKKC